MWPELEEDEEEEEEKGGKSLLVIRQEVVEYILRRYGNFRAKDIARILGCKVGNVTHILANLEHQGRAKRLKLGRSSVWVPVEESSGPMYY